MVDQKGDQVPLVPEFHPVAAQVDNSSGPDYLLDLIRGKSAVRVEQPPVKNVLVAVLVAGAAGIQSGFNGDSLTLLVKNNFTPISVLFRGYCW
jgi:hypothetical protein